MKLKNSMHGGAVVWFLAVLVGLTSWSGTGHQVEAAQPVQLTIQGFMQGTTMHVRAEGIGELLRKFSGYQVTVKTGTGLSGPIGLIQGKIDMMISLGPYIINKESVQKDAPDLAPRYKETLIFATEEKGEHLVVLDRVKGSSLSDVFAKKYPIKVGIGVTGSRLVAEKIFKALGVSSQDIESWGESGRYCQSNPNYRVHEGRILRGPFHIWWFGILLY